MLPLQDRRVVVGVTGGIAAYKSVDLVSRLVKLGAQVDVVMTPSAREFLTPISYQSLTQRPVITDMFSILSEMSSNHVALGERAEIVVIAPATANTIARIAAGMSDDMLTTTVLATEAPIVVAAAMNDLMYANAATQENLARLRQRGMVIIEPRYGRLASGKYGQGRLAEVDDIVDVVRGVLGRTGDYAGKRVVVTAGGTQEPIDPVRFISNRSSGKMGYAVAEAARDRGARVTLITAPTALRPPADVETVPVRTAEEMLDRVLSACDDADLLVMAAAVADYRMAHVAEQKIKKAWGDGLTLELINNPDILRAVNERHGAKTGPVRVGFAAETADLLANARAKLGSKGLDLVVANDVTLPGSGFGTETNQVMLVHKGGTDELPLLSKYEVARRILDYVLPIIDARRV